MKIAVITAYYNETFEQLMKCHDSVVKQSGDVTHFMVSDGKPHPDIDYWNGVVHIKIPNHGDYGDTPRGVGSASAAAQGYDAICFLDADNWYEPDHIENMLYAVETTGAQVVTMARHIYTKDFRLLGMCHESDGLTFNDTNCYFITRPAFPACAAWMFKDQSDGIVGDRRFWEAIKTGGYSRAHVAAPTINYVSTLAFHYQMFGETPPDDSKVIVKKTYDEPFTMVSYAEFKKLSGQR
jgi:glycosyltransferase involved in cell wall biosynthesis